MKNIGDFYLKIFRFLEIKFSIYLNRCVFVMDYVSVSQSVWMYKLICVFSHSMTLLVFEQERPGTKNVEAFVGHGSGEDRVRSFGEKEVVVGWKRLLLC